jgi:hypothetical protein
MTDPPGSFSIADRVLAWLIAQISRGYLWVHRRAPFCCITVYRVLIRTLGAPLLRRVLDQPPLPVPEPAPGDVCVHVLTKQNECLFALWACRSLLERLDRPLPVFIHADGSLTPRHVALMKSSLPGVRVVTRTEADRLARERLSGLPKCLRLRKTNVLSIKLFDPWIVQETGDVILLDSDVLFFRQPAEVLQWLDDPESRVNRWNVESGWAGTPAAIRERGGTAKEGSPGKGINSGFGLVTRASICFSAIESWLTGIDRPNDWLIEQNIYGWLSEVAGTARLPLEYHVANASGLRPDASVSIHYVGSVRGFFIAEGIPRLVSCPRRRQTVRHQLDDRSVS